MKEERVTFIISMILVLGFFAYIAIKLQNTYTSSAQITEPKNLKPLDPVEKWEAVREQRAHDLDEAHEQGISHAKLIIQKCDCPHLFFDESLYESNTQEKALAKWRYLECKKACDDVGISATTTP